MKKIVFTDAAPKAIGPYSQAVEANGTLYISGQVPIDPATGKLVEGGIREQTEQVMKNLEAILHEAQYSFGNVVKTTIFLSDMSLFTQVNEIYSKYFTGDFPARETVAVKGLPKNVNVEISVIASR